MAKRGGTVVIGGLKDRKPVDGFISDWIPMRQLHLHAGFPGDHVKTSIELIRQGRVPTAALLGEAVTVDGLGDALRLLARALPGRDAIRLALRMAELTARSDRLATMAFDTDDSDDTEHRHCDDTFDSGDYDEFGLLGDNAAEAGLPLTAPPRVTRTAFTVPTGRPCPRSPGATPNRSWSCCTAAARTRTPGTPSRWRSAARCWRSTCPATGTPAAARTATTAPGATPRRSPRSSSRPRPPPAASSGCRSAGPPSSGSRPPARTWSAGRCIVDVTPNSGVRSRALASADRGAVALVSGPPVYESFEAMAAAAVAASPNRPRSAVERGVRHNARRLPDGRWTWRYDLFGERPAAVGDHTGLWADVPAITAGVMLVLGADSPFTAEQDVAEFRRLLPAARVEVVPDAGHAIQSDQPLRLTQLIEDFVFSTATSQNRSL